MKAAKQNSFFKTCSVCKGKGDIQSSHKLAKNASGYITGVAHPFRAGGCSGEIIAEATRSYCGACGGCGIKLIQEK